MVDLSATFFIWFIAAFAGTFGIGWVVIMTCQNTIGTRLN
jgi:hypothetical protein